MVNRRRLGGRLDLLGPVVTDAAGSPRALRGDHVELTAVRDAVDFDAPAGQRFDVTGSGLLGVCGPLGGRV